MKRRNGGVLGSKTREGKGEIKEKRLVEEKSKGGDMHREENESYY